MRSTLRLRLRALSLLSPLLAAGCAASSGESALAGSIAEPVETCGSAIGDAVSVAAHAGESTVRADVDSTANRVASGPYVGGAAIGDAMVDLVAHARREVLVEFFDIDASSWLAVRLRAAIAALPRSVRVYVIASPQGGAYGAGPFSFIPESRSHLVTRLRAFFDLPNVTVASWSPGLNPFHVMHSKLVVVDGARALVTDTNLQPHGDPAGSGPRADGWFQMATVVEGQVAATLREDAAAAFDGAYPSASLPAAPPAAPAAACTRMVVLGRRAGASETSSADRGYAALLGAASASLRVVTPNLNAPEALAALAGATAHADVRVVLSRGFNDGTEGLPGQGGTNATNVGKLAARATDPCRLHVRWFAAEDGKVVDGNGAGASHAKWASADGRAMILGSQNLDTQSWHQSRELGLLVDDARATADFDAIFERTWSRSAPAFECASSRQ